MATARTAQPRRLASPTIQALIRQRSAGLGGLALGLLGLTLLVALACYDPRDPSLNTATSRHTGNLAGPVGAVLTPGISMKTGTAPDAAPAYTDNRGLFITWRASDDNAPIWANNSTTKNWVHELFLNIVTPVLVRSFLGNSITGSGPVNDSGATYAYQDCGVNVTPAPANCANSTT